MCGIFYHEIWFGIFDGENNVFVCHNLNDIRQFIEFPLELDLTDRCSSQSSTNSSTYSLYAVIEHTGTLRSGHYVAYVKQSFGDNQFSDEIYSKPIDLLLTDLFKT